MKEELHCTLYIGQRNEIDHEILYIVVYGEKNTQDKTADGGFYRFIHIANTSFIIVYTTIY